MRSLMRENESERAKSLASQGGGGVVAGDEGGGG